MQAYPSKMAKAVKEIRLPKFYFSFQVLLLRLTGIDLLGRNESLPYKTYFMVAFLFTSFYVVLECIELKYHPDFNTISIISWYIIMDILTLAKVAVIYTNRKGIGNMMKSFHKGFYKPDKIKGGEFEKYCIHKILSQNRSQMTPYGIFVVTAWAAGLVASLKSRLTKLPENWSLPYFTLSMLDTAHSPTFEIAYIYQGLGAFFFCLWIYICDFTVISLIAQTVAQLKVLEHCVRNYKYRSLKMPVEEKNESNNYRLGETIEHHITLLETVDEVESLSSYLVLCVFLANLIMLCLTMYNASLISIRSIEFVKHLAYSALVAAQTLLYCWWGNEMTIANKALALGIYETYTPDDPTPHAEALRLMLVKAQKPLFFTAGKFIPLSLETYMRIMKGSFSYFTVLRQINAK